MVDEAGTPDLTGYEAMLAQAKVAAADAPPAVGEEAFFGPNDQLWVRTQTSAMSFGLAQETDETKAELERIAAAVVKAGDVLECEQVPQLLPAKVRASGSPSAKTLQAGANTVSVCSMPLVIDGQRDLLTVTYTLGTDVFESTKESSRLEPIRVAGVGDSAIAYDDCLLFRSGDRAYVVSGTDADGHPISAKLQVEIARAVLSRRCCRGQTELDRDVDPEHSRVPVRPLSRALGNLDRPLRRAIAERTAAHLDRNVFRVVDLRSDLAGQGRIAHVMRENESFHHAGWVVGHRKPRIQISPPHIAPGSEQLTEVGAIRHKLCGIPQAVIEEGVDPVIRRCGPRHVVVDPMDRNRQAAKTCGFQSWPELRIADVERPAHCVKRSPVDPVDVLLHPAVISEFARLPPNVAIARDRSLGRERAERLGQAGQRRSAHLSSHRMIAIVAAVALIFLIRLTLVLRHR